MGTHSVGRASYHAGNVTATGLEHFTVLCVQDRYACKNVCLVLCIITTVAMQCMQDNFKMAAVLEVILSNII